MNNAHYPLATIVGGSGFIGRHIVKALARSGWRIRVLCRDPIEAEFLKPAGTVGQVVLQYADITKPETLKGKFDGSDVVISLVSIFHQRGRQNFPGINVDGARRVAEMAAAAGATRLVHLSALGVDRAGDTKYGATKLAGEQAVRNAFPAATILRPGLVVGPEDRFFQRFARLSLIAPFMPMIGGGRTRFQPVLVTDVAAAVSHAIEHPETAGKTYELAGPETFSFCQLMAMMMKITRRKRPTLSIPFALAAVKGFCFELLPFRPPITRDQVMLLRHDSVMTPGALGFPELGLVPGSIAAALPALLARFTRG